jgi:cardiolipin synthase
MPRINYNKNLYLPPFRRQFAKIWFRHEAICQNLRFQKARFCVIIQKSGKFMLKTEELPKINPVETRSNNRLSRREPALKNVLPEEAFTRIAETPLIRNNGVRILKDAAENYPAWLAAIEKAEKTIHFESYIIHEDEQGHLFADALIKKAKEGVRVRLIYDWMGGFGKTSRRFWRQLRNGGVEVRCYNSFSFARPLGWINRDHRKVLIVDGEIAFVTGLCVGQMWAGEPEKGIEPWRDTGIELRGKAVADVDRAFADVWDDLGSPIPKTQIADYQSLENAGGTNLRVVATKPGNARVYRLDQMVAALSRETLWLTDAYFAGTHSYIESLRSAAMDGVDVRLLLPAATDIPVMQAISRSGYRSLLEAGVRIYEWNGPMIHAKTAVIDGFWSRVGSTNLNIASWLINCEIDVLIEDKNFGREMQEMYLADLENATEISLNEKQKAFPVKRRARKGGAGSSSSARFAPSAIAVGSALRSSISTDKKRPLGTMEAKINLFGGGMLLTFGIVAIFWSKLIAVPLGIIGVWLAVSLFVNSYQLFQQAKKEAGSKRTKLQTDTDDKRLIRKNEVDEIDITNK